MDKIANDDFSSQLRSLRQILGKNFRPISTKALASLSGIAVVSIRAVESGRRQLDALDRFIIELNVGTRWNPENGQWIDVRKSSAGEQTLFTREKYDSHIGQLRRGPELERLREEYHTLVDQYLNRLESAELQFGLSKLYYALAQIQKSAGGSLVIQVEKGTNRLLVKHGDRLQNSAAAFDKSVTKRRLLRSLQQKKEPTSRQ